MSGNCLHTLYCSTCCTGASVRASSWRIRPTIRNSTFSTTFGRSSSNSNTPGWVRAKSLLTARQTQTTQGAYALNAYWQFVKLKTPQGEYALNPYWQLVNSNIPGYVCAKSLLTAGQTQISQGTYALNPYWQLVKLKYPRVRTHYILTDSSSNSMTLGYVQTHPRVGTRQILTERWS